MKWTCEDAKRAYRAKPHEVEPSCESDYDPIIDSIGAPVIKVSDDEYQGDTRILFQGAIGFGHLIIGWGSCSGCDALQACESWQEIADLRNRLDDAVIWLPQDQMLAWFRNHDWGGDWSANDEKTIEYRKACELLLSHGCQYVGLI